MEWLEHAEGVIALISALVVLIGAIAALVPTLIKRGKEIAQLVKEKKYTELINSLKATADATIRAVEKSKLSGADKKATVLDAIQAACNSQGAEFTDELKETMSTFIDQSVTEYNEFKDLATKTTTKKTK